MSTSPPTNASTRTLAARLRRHREDRKLSLDAVARAAGISKTYLWELEADHAGDKHPSLDVLGRVAAALHVGLGDLIGSSMRRPPEVPVRATIGLYELKSAMRAATIDNERFDVGWWSIADAEYLESAARLIRREIAEREAGREP